jgi:hypothetical protein
MAGQSIVADACGVLSAAALFAFAPIELLHELDAFPEARHAGNSLEASEHQLPGVDILAVSADGVLAVNGQVALPVVIDLVVIELGEALLAVGRLTYYL